MLCSKHNIIRRTPTAAVHALSSTICTMKIIIFFVLAGFSLAQEEDLNCPEEIIPKENEECMTETLETLSDSTKELKTFICKYQGTFDDNEDNYDSSMKEIIRALACSGCDADKLLGMKNETFEEIFEDIGKIGDKGGELVVKVTDALGLTEGLTTFLCHQVGDVLVAECKEKLLKKEVPELLKDLKKLYCKYDLNKLTGEDTVEMMSILGCIGDKTLHTKETLKNMFRDIGDDLKPTLDKILDAIKEITAKEGLVSDVVCDVTEVVLGEKPLLDVGGGNGPVGEVLHGGDGDDGGLLGGLGEVLGGDGDDGGLLGEVLGGDGDDGGLLGR
ncbi:uncharacterized protein LOC130281757 [Hyla sarda]|uniref:uncharacterized protein LOC130281757 n=1 Tax=Hyla sarda TaxID=327740 RepID=UPI0024C40992|nr:uncharacterized protein LOC130281757 [Hyla sarda]